MNRGGPARGSGTGAIRGNPKNTPGANQPNRANEGRHIPREFKYIFLLIQRTISQETSILFYSP